jgi:hypothetical protein
MAEETADAPSTLMAEATAEPSAKEEALPEPVELHEPIAGMTTAAGELQIPTWNLGERIPIQPQIWDADTPQVGVGAANEDVDIVTLYDSETTPAVPKPPKKSPKEKRKKKRKKWAQQESDGRLVIRLKKAGSAQPADATEDEGRPGGTTEIFYPETVNSSADGAVLAWRVYSYPEDPYLVRMRCGRPTARSRTGRRSTHRRQ